MTMAKRIDPLNRIGNKVRGNDGVSTIINIASLHALGYALPLGVPFKTVPSVQAPDRSALEGSGLNTGLMQAPMTLRWGEGKSYSFPIDPVLSVDCKNIITRRYVAKGSVRGTVKESWSVDDYEVTVAGVLIGSTAEELLEMLAELRELCMTDDVLAVENDWLNDGFGVSNLVLESYSFPHTSGLTNQAYSLKFYSDDCIKILEEA